MADARIHLEKAVMVLLLIGFAVFLPACGTLKEEKERMQAMAAVGEANAVKYIREKYGFEPEVVQAKACTVRDAGFKLQTTGSVDVWMAHGQQEFRVHISGEEEGKEGLDDYQYGLIKAEAKAYFSGLLGYEIYDLYLEYRDRQIAGDRYSDEQEENMLNGLYQEGGFGDFMEQHPVYCRIDDCLGQDLTGFAMANPDAAAYLEEAANHYGLRAVLISYKSQEDYGRGYAHTYGRSGLTDFGIEQDSFYIQSYAVFEEEGVKYRRFETQELDGIFFCCVDKGNGDGILAKSGKVTWQELGKTKKDPVSEIYSVAKEEAGEITVYIPEGLFWEVWKGGTVYIQHYGNGRWWQYEPNIAYTRDKKYIFFTYHNVKGGGFDFAVFPCIIFHWVSIQAVYPLG